jgi:hypothetical protein
LTALLDKPFARGGGHQFAMLDTFGPDKFLGKIFIFLVLPFKTTTSRQ